MRFNRKFYCSLAALALLGSSMHAKADTTLDFSETSTLTPTNFAAGDGVGQAVLATESVDVDSFGFFLAQKAGGTVNYFVYDATAGTYALAPDAVAIPASTTKAWDYLTGIDVTLNAGDLYYFGVYGNSAMIVGMDPTASFYDDGMQLPTSGPTSYDFTGDVATTALTGALNAEGLSTTDVGVRIYDPPLFAATTPEPSSLVLLGTGILGVAGAMRRRWAR